MTDKELMEIIKAITSLQNKYPDVHYQGFLNETKPLLIHCLDDKPEFKSQIEHCLSWFKANKKVKPTIKPNPYARLGVLKHNVERFVNRERHIAYISRGAVLVAAEILGIKHDRDLLFITKRALDFP